MSKTKTRKPSRTKNRARNIRRAKAAPTKHAERHLENCPKCGTAMVIQVSCPKCHYSPETAYASLREAKEFTHPG